jgi:CBS domain-containing protein
MSAERKVIDMVIGDVCNRDVVCASRETTAATAAKLMRQHHVGDVIVIDRADAERMPIGIVTDRDIVVEVVALGVDPNAVTLGDMISWGELVTAQESASYADTLRLMHDNGVRRIPVINATGVLVGVISIDDILPRFVVELSEMADLATRGRQRERQTRTAPIGSTT